VPIISLAPDLILFGISDKFELDDVVLDKKLGQGMLMEVIVLFCSVCLFV
jgi:hypothetical protein